MVTSGWFIDCVSRLDDPGWKTGQRVCVSLHGHKVHADVLLTIYTPCAGGWEMERRSARKEGGRDNWQVFLVMEIGCRHTRSLSHKKLGGPLSGYHV